MWGDSYADFYLFCLAENRLNSLTIQLAQKHLGSSRGVSGKMRTFEPVSSIKFSQQPNDSV